MPQTRLAGIEHTEGLLALALGELEAAREREEADLARRTAGLQARFAADMAELERGFLLQAEALQQRLAREVEEETARGQQVRGGGRGPASGVGLLRSYRAGVQMGLCYTTHNLSLSAVVPKDAGPDSSLPRCTSCRHWMHWHSRC